MGFCPSWFFCADCDNKGLIRIGQEEGDFFLPYSFFNDMPYSPEIKWQFYLGDRETAISYWSGPQPSSTQRSANNFRQYLDRSINSYNIIKEIVAHYSNALVGKPFGYTENETLTEWLHTQRRLSAFRRRTDPFLESVVQALVSGRSFIRLYSPQRFKDSGSPYLAVTPHLCHLQDSSPEYDSDGFLERFTYTYRDKGGSQNQEEYFVDDNGYTHIKSNKEEIVIYRNGMLPIFELSIDPVISDAAICSQRTLTVLLTMLNEFICSSALPEHIVTNAQVPGQMIEDPDHPRGQRFEPRQDLLEFGANQLVMLDGKPIGDPDMPSGFTNPSVYFKDPSNPQAFRTALDILVETVYRETGLGHLLTSGDGSLSGISRVTLKSDFELRLQIYKEYIEDFYNAILEYVLMELGQSNPYVETSLNLDTGNILPEERKAILEELNTGVRSRRSSMMMLGIEDPEEEERQIQEERNRDMGEEIIPDEEALL